MNINIILYYYLCVYLAQNEHRGEISYSSVILSLRLKLLQMKRCHFLQCPSSISELEWYFVC